MSDGPPDDRKPLSDAEVKLQFDYLIAELGEARGAIKELQDSRKTHDARIMRLMMRTETIRTIVSDLRRTSRQQATDLNQLGQKRLAKLEGWVGTAKIIGGIVIALASAGVAFFVYILHFLEAHIVFKP